MRNLLLILGVFLLAFGARATHLVGGEITYEHFENDEYIITLTIYRDCGPNNTNNTQFDSDASIGIFDANGNLINQLSFNNPKITNLPVVINNPCLQSPPGICVEKGVYQDVVVLPPQPGGYYIVYQRCCRTPSVLNIINPQNTGNTYSVHVPDPALAVDNSSPVFNSEPSLVICVNDNFVYDHSATDYDGDSLDYAFVTPLEGGSPGIPAPSPPSAPPHSGVNWVPGYSANYPLDAQPGFAIDRQTGIITGYPNRIGQYAFAVAVREYRNGVYIGQSIRDFRLDVANCISNIKAAIPDRDSADICNGRTVNFGNNSLNTNNFYWDFGDPNNPNGNSGDKFPTYTYSDTGTFTIMLVAEPSYPCADTAFITYVVSEPVRAELTPPSDQCFEGHEFDFQADGNIESNASFYWDFGPDANPQISIQENPTGITFDAPGYKKITYVLIQNGCADSIIDTIYVEPQPRVEFTLDDFEGCVPYEIQPVNLSSADEITSYTWDFGDGTTSTDPFPTHEYSTPGTYPIRLTIEVNSLCGNTFVYDPGDIIVHPSPTARFSVYPDSMSIFEAEVSLSDASKDAVQTWYYFENGDRRPGPLATYTFKTPGVHWIKQVVVNTAGCTHERWKSVRVEPAPCYIPNAFTPNGDGINDNFIPKIVGVETFHMEIYDRWGKFLYETNNMSYGWDGRIIGVEKPAKGGTYVYQIRFIDLAGGETKKAGLVNLVR